MTPCPLGYVTGVPTHHPAIPSVPTHHPPSRTFPHTIPPSGAFPRTIPPFGAFSHTIPPSGAFPVLPNRPPASRDEWRRRRLLCRRPGTPGRPPSLHRSQPPDGGGH